MRIIILGAGQVGATLAEHLAGEANDITLVDSDSRRLSALQDRLDLRTCCGSAAHPAVLARAGAEDADMLVAVTSSDEVNMVACQVAQSLFNIPQRIARVREQAYLQQADLLFQRQGIPVDVLISPEQLVTLALQRLVEHPGALQVVDFANGRAQLVAFKVGPQGPLAGAEIASLRERLPALDFRVAAIFRRERALVPRGDTQIEAADEVFFIAASEQIPALMRALCPQHRLGRRLMIAGGGNIGFRLAARLERDYRVKLIEQDLLRCQWLSESLARTTVLHGSASDRDLLIEEGVDGMDVFLALTNDDEANVMSSLLARQLGADMLVCLISNPAYVDLVQGGQIDIAVSPQQSTVGALLAHVRRGHVVAVHALRRGAAEALEVVAHGDADSSQVVGRRLDELRLPSSATVGALVRDGEVLIAHDDLRVQTDDHLIVFVAERFQVADVERLFQVGITFL